MHKSWLAISSILLLSPTFSYATNEAECVLALYREANKQMTIEEMRAKCQAKAPEEIAQVSTDEEKQAEVSTVAGAQKGLISQRIEAERNSEWQSYVLTPHRMNYILPVMSTNEINPKAYNDIPGYDENFEDLEAKFQLSLKVPLNTNDLFVEGDALFFAFTLEAWWQIYSENISKPFRETNYQPEVFYLMPLNWELFGGQTHFVVGMEHQSNGRSQLLSRSWNRAYVNFLWEKENFAVSLRPWYRLKEDEKEFELDPDGDDNPDILDYMGHYELAMAYAWNEMELGFMGRYNLGTNKGSGEVSFTFPIYGKLKGYVNVFNGYGESLIDYNHNQTRIGLGFAINDFL